MLPGQRITPEEILRILRRRWWIIVLPFLLVTPPAALYIRALPDIYRSETLILVIPQRVPESYVKSTVTARIEDRLQSIQQQILSRSRLERMILDFNLYEEERRRGVLMEDIVQRMANSDVDVNIERGDAFRIQYVNGNPRLAQKVTERLATLFIDENLLDRERLAEGTSQFLEAQLEDARRRLVEQERRLEQFKRENAGELPSQAQANFQTIQGLQNQIRSITDSINLDRQQRLVLERQRSEIQAANTAELETLAPRSDGPAAGSPAQQLQSARAQLRALELKYGPDHPELKNARRLIVELEAQAGGTATAAAPGDPAATPGARTRATRLNSLDSDIALLDSQTKKKLDEEARLRAELQVYQRRLDAAPTREVEMTELTRDYATLQGMYTSLLAKREDSKVAANLERRQIGEQFRILDQARVPERPFSPDRLQLNAMAAIGSLGFGFAIAALLELRDATFRTATQVTQILNLPVLALIPVMRSDAQRRRRRRLFVLAGVGVVVLLLCGAGAAYAAWKMQLL